MIGFFTGYVHDFFSSTSPNVWARSFSSDDSGISAVFVATEFEYEDYEKHNDEYF